MPTVTYPSHTTLVTGVAPRVHGIVTNKPDAFTRPLLAALAPFALDLWRHEISDWLPAAARAGGRKQSSFGALYQKIVIKR